MFEMSDADSAVARAHIKRFPNGSVCPICGGTNWNVGGLDRALVYDNRDDLSSKSAANRFYVAVLVISCTACFFVRQFLWDEIAKAAPATP